MSSILAIHVKILEYLQFRVFFLSFSLESSTLMGRYVINTENPACVVLREIVLRRWQQAVCAFSEPLCGFLCYVTLCDGLQLRYAYANSKWSGMDGVGRRESRMEESIPFLSTQDETHNCAVQPHHTISNQYDTIVNLCKMAECQEKKKKKSCTHVASEH